MISCGLFGSASIFLRNLPTSTSMLRSNGSKRRLVKASNRVSRLITRPGRVTNILSKANSPCVSWIASPESRASVQALGLNTRPAKRRGNVTSDLISDLEDAEAGFTGVKPTGLVRIDVHGTQARHFLLPGLPRFLDAYPDIRLHIGEAHQALDMVREGFDCMLRAGELTVDSALIRRRLATLDRGTFASPAYISRFGMPESVDALEADGHRMVGFYAPDAPEVAPFNFLIDGKSRRLSLPSFITVTGPETNVASACMGLGLIQIPRYRAAAELASGKLVEVLPQFPPPALPVHVLYSHTRQLSPRLRVVIDWMAEQFRSLVTL